MTFTEAKKEYLQTYCELMNKKTVKELVETIGITTIRCGWVDHVDYLIKNKKVNEKIAYKWGQVL